MLSCPAHSTMTSTTTTKAWTSCSGTLPLSSSAVKGSLLFATLCTYHSQSRVVKDESSSLILPSHRTPVSTLMQQKENASEEMLVKVDPFSTQERKVLGDITDSPPPSSGPSFLPIPSATSSQTHIHRKKIPTRHTVKSHRGLEHTKKVIRRRNAISLTTQQAALLATQLSTAKYNPKQVKFNLVPLDRNVYLVSRSDGHTITCTGASENGSCTCILN